MGIIMVQGVDVCAFGVAAGFSAGAVPGTTVAAGMAGVTAFVFNNLPISMPIKKSRMQSNTRQAPAIATIREVMVKTY